MGLLLLQFLGPLILASVVAWPIAYVFMRNWLDGFDQRISLAPGYFIEATLVALAVGLLTVVGQAVSVARADPAQVLRHD